jgi:mannose-6-phosphate isomerase-like protein (cupin superfamily)
MSLFGISLGIALLVGTLQGAGVEFWSGSELKSSAERLEQEAGTKGIAGTTSGAASIWRRAKSGEAELHKTKTDVLVIQQGSATLVFGGTIPDARTSAPNEIRGKSIRNGESRKLVPGDIIRIPAGIPHQFILEKGQQVAYFALKLTR